MPELATKPLPQTTGWKRSVKAPWGPVAPRLPWGGCAALVCFWPPAACRPPAPVPQRLVMNQRLAVPSHPGLPPPFTFTGKQPLLGANKPYRGRMGVSSDGKIVQVIDTIGLESYLKGVVPAEVPWAWP